MTTPAALQAAEITGTLWAAICAAGGPQRPAPQGHRHFPNAYDAGWLAALPLPTGECRPPQQPVALLDDRDEFERHHDGEALTSAYTSRPRTQVYEDIGRDAPDTWHSIAAQHLSRLAKCELNVTCSIFASRTGDESLGAHFDTWYGAILQVDGAKTWTIGPGLLKETAQPCEEVATKAGDVLLLPDGLPHMVNTPREPGHSVHLTFAIHRQDFPER